ncbi:hypothetical protein HU200_046632 [Digitaria exilis]|uniref:Uncharacterized protein n=1 Tax=Digitaria exilis TaxID=1010633 RepID=A0A835AY72_9POAL|nr:hypothetical protein HU200_046632 [Digitaria exilis]
MEPRREELLHELGVHGRACPLNASSSLSACRWIIGSPEMWDEIGEGEDDRRGMLQALEEECLNVYRAKVDQLRREIADSVAEVAAICATIGEPPATVQTACSSLQGTGNLREELGSISPELAEMRRRRDERRRQFSDVTERVNRIHQEMNLAAGDGRVVATDGSDLTLTKLEELRAYLQHLQSEKVAELIALLHSSSLVLGMDPREINAAAGHGGQAAGDFSDAAIARLASEIERLREIKRSRMDKVIEPPPFPSDIKRLQDSARPGGHHAGVVEPDGYAGGGAEKVPERRLQHRRVRGRDHRPRRALHGLHKQRRLAFSLIGRRRRGPSSSSPVAAVEAEVVRLETLKECRMKDLVAKKYDELKEVRRRARLPEEDDGDAVAMFDAIDSGMFDRQSPWILQYKLRALILERLEVQISEAKDLEFSRKDVLERMDKWQAALEEESWLEEYNRALTTKVTAWEKERGVKFEYDGMLEEYGNARKEKEQERKRQRDQRRLQGAAAAAAAAERDVSSPVARPPPKNIKNVTRTLSMGGSNGGGGSARKTTTASSRPGTPSYLTKSPIDEGQMMASDSFE